MMKAVLWHSASCARATHGRTQTNKTTTMIPISTPAIARITTSRVPSSLVIVSFTFEVQGGGKRRAGNLDRRLGWLRRFLRIGVKFFYCGQMQLGRIF
jgi:hypothetical protein